VRSGKFSGVRSGAERDGGRGRLKRKRKEKTTHARRGRDCLSAFERGRDIGAERRKKGER
jgi:hypothetical protein